MQRVWFLLRSEAHNCGEPRTRAPLCLYAAKSWWALGWGPALLQGGALLAPLDDLKHALHGRGRGVRHLVPHGRREAELHLAVDRHQRALPQAEHVGREHRVLSKTAHAGSGAAASRRPTWPGTCPWGTMWGSMLKCSSAKSSGVPEVLTMMSLECTSSPCPYRANLYHARASHLRATATTQIPGMCAPSCTA